MSIAPIEPPALADRGRHLTEHAGLVLEPMRSVRLKEALGVTGMVPCLSVRCRAFFVTAGGNHTFAKVRRSRRRFPPRAVSATDSYDWAAMAADRELFLIDGNSLAYRAFFALPETIATSRGEPTNAIFGFASMLVKILTEYGPKATIVVWDAGMSGREQAVRALQGRAQAAARPAARAVAAPRAAGRGVRLRERARRGLRGRRRDREPRRAGQGGRASPVMIVTGDRDAYQLPDDGRVRVMTTSRGITDTRVYDREGVVERYGIPPELVPDFIGLKGDTSDNIPGVPGIGDKTAAQLLQQYGSLEEVLAHIDEISGEKRRQNLRENADLARISKELATLQRDIDAGIDVDRGRRPRARPLAAARGVHALRAARSAAAPRGGARRAEAAPRQTGERRVEATRARGLARRPRGAGGRRPRSPRERDGRRGALGGGAGDEVADRHAPSTLARAARGVGRAAAGRARLEGDQPRRAVAGDDGLQRHARSRTTRWSPPT